MSSQSNPTHNTKSYHYKPDYLSLLLLFFSSRQPTLNPSVVYFLPLFSRRWAEEPPDWFVAKRWTYLFPFVWKSSTLPFYPLSVCLFDWQGLLDYNRRNSPPLLLLSTDNSPTDSELCLFFGRHTTESWKEPARVRPSPSAPNSPPSTTTTTRWNEHFSRPETFNLALFWRELIETYPLAAFFALAAPSPQNPCLDSIRIMADGAAVALVVEKCGFSQEAYSDRKSLSPESGISVCTSAVHCPDCVNIERADRSRYCDAVEAHL